MRRRTRSGGEKFNHSKVVSPTRYRVVLTQSTPLEEPVVEP